MAKKSKEGSRPSNNDRKTKSKRVEEEEEDEEEDQNDGFFGRLFSPGTVDTSVSENTDDEEYESDSDESAGSGTYYTDVTGDSDSGSEESSTARSNGSSLVRFDRDLRAKHRAACKSMTIGKYARAIRIFESILSALLNRYGEEHHRVGSALHNVAVANLRSGLLDDARDAIEEAVRIRKRTLGEDEPKVADSLVEYGIILLSMKKYKKSIQVFEDALELREIECCEAEDAATKREAKLKKAKIQHNIGCVNFEIKNYDEARRKYMQAIQEQKEIFGSSWFSAFRLVSNTSKPGHLTMASTMCNKGYIDIEQEKYKDAIDTLMESLKIQKVLLEADNKLILSTMTNIAYCYCKLQEPEKARVVYKDLVKLQSESYTEQSQRGWSQSLKKLVYCQVVLFEFEDAFDNLRLLEEYLTSRARDKVKNAASDLRRTHQLMGEVNYQIFKFPTLSDYTSRLSCTNGCGCSDDRATVNISNWIPKKPVNGSKMSGHRMTYA
eukprot:CAMPEP_0172367352 /NCGR_PEP_ID=MMETSP1060-20121228/20858_1 /TAXON_ID=37318 /ORGANISM="Pseudo-nitzschia pungens, Strain cf. cingulata" /LENGTH=494 /DNA_ID=CAMNT_0013091573 /DNA_START=82 /DNA_END=1566 /DNA_ORIENTATION=+